MKKLHFILFLISFCANASAQTIISLKTDPLSGQYTTFTVQSVQSDTLNVNGKDYPLEWGCYSFVRKGQFYQGLPGQVFEFDPLVEGSQEVPGLEIDGQLVPVGIPGVDYFDVFIISQAPFSPVQMTVYFNQITNTIETTHGQLFNGYTSTQPDAIELGYGYYLNVGLGGVICQINLPVELKSFEATEGGCRVELVWKTATETNVSHFEVQESANGTDFVAFGRVDAAGESQVERTYTYTDEQLTASNYYRLHIVDFDGSAAFSDIILVTADCASGVSVSDIFPNPVREQLNINVNSNVDHETANVVVTDNLGRTVLTKGTEVFFGSNVINLDVNALPQGTYCITIQGENGWFTQPTPFVKVK